MNSKSGSPNFKPTGESFSSIAFYVMPPSHSDKNQKARTAFKRRENGSMQGKKSFQDGST